ncbi:uncharacterized protein V2V93DRAFT_361389 [Kockiozyma suomiensis]|uniref:uncharacterized protein n=1 Tax=Kockiozyma suomiensis TaxID=1337062 RepID=UPI00334400ED
MVSYNSLTYLLLACAPALVSAQNAKAAVVLSDNYRTVAPPNDAFAQNSSHVFVSTTVMFSIAIFFLVVASYDCRKFNSSIPRAMIFGAAPCVIPEAIDNYLAGCYWSQSHDPNKLMFFLMGREFDYYVAIMWWAFGAILGYVLYAALLREVKTGTLWVCLALSGVADIILEEILLGYGGIYTYFGHQPMVLIKNFPWWWLFSNVSSLFLSVALAYRYRQWFEGWRSAFILALMPFCYIGGFTLTAMPTIFAIQGNFSAPVSEACGVFTSVMGIIQAGTIINLILDRDPYDLSYSPASVKLANGKDTLNGKYGNAYANGNGVAAKGKPKA